MCYLLDFKLYKHVRNEGIWLYLNVFLATIWSLKKGEVFQVENWRSNFLLPGSSCLGCAASVTKLNLLKERGNSSPYFKSPKPSKESLHFHFPFFLFTMTIQTTFFNEFHLVTKQPTKKSIWNLNFHAKNILNSYRMFDSFFFFPSKEFPDKRQSVREICLDTFHDCETMAIGIYHLVL